MSTTAQNPEAETKQVTLSRGTLYEVVDQMYMAWTEKADILRQTKALQYDPTSDETLNDWRARHQIMLADATKHERATYQRFLEVQAEYTKHWPL